MERPETVAVKVTLPASATVSEVGVREMLSLVVAVTFTVIVLVESRMPPELAVQYTVSEPVSRNDRLKLKVPLEAVAVVLVCETPFSTGVIVTPLRPLPFWSVALPEKVWEAPSITLIVEVVGEVKATAVKTNGAGSTVIEIELLVMLPLTAVMVKLPATPKVMELEKAPVEELAHVPIAEPFSS